MVEFLFTEDNGFNNRFIQWIVKNNLNIFMMPVPAICSITSLCIYCFRFHLGRVA